jgi:hypothetical protein
MALNGRMQPINRQTPVQHGAQASRVHADNGVVRGYWPTTRANASSNADDHRCTLKDGKGCCKEEGREEGEIFMIRNDLGYSNIQKKRRMYTWASVP